MGNILSEFIKPLVDLKLSRQLFRALAIAGLLLIALSQITWGSNVFARIFGFPELRHSITQETVDSSGNKSYKLTVVNLGLTMAKNVVIHVYIQNADNISYYVNSQELYEVKNADLETGIIDIWLERLAPGANISLQLILKAAGNDSIAVSAVADSGTSVGLDTHTFSQQVASYSAGIRGLFGDAWQLVRQRPVALSLAQLSTKQSWVGNVIRTVQSQDFKTIGLATLIIILAVAAFFPDASGLVIPLLTSTLVVLFVEWRIPAWPVVIIAAIYITLAAIRAAEGGCLAYLAGIIPMLLGVILAVVWRNETLSANWFLVPATFILTALFVPSPPRQTSNYAVSGVAQQYNQRISECERQLSELRTEISILQHDLQKQRYGRRRSRSSMRQVPE